MEIGISDYVVFFISGGVTLYSFYDALPKISSLTALAGMLTTVWLFFILFHERIPPLRNVFGYIYDKIRN